MVNINQIKITQRDAEVLKLLIQGCSNKEIAAQLGISPRTVKQHLRTLFLRAGIREGRKRVKLATAVLSDSEKLNMRLPLSRCATKACFSAWRSRPLGWPWTMR